MPDGIAGTISGSYMNISPSGGGGGTNLWGVDAAGAFGLGDFPALGAEVNGGYHNISLTGVSSNLWNVGGSAFWAGFPGRAGATVSYLSGSSSGGGITVNANITNYGAFLEYYFSDVLTAGVKAGGLTVSGSAAGGGFGGSGTGSGSYVGGGLIGYVVPDLALSGHILYKSAGGGGNATNYFVGAEYLVSEQLPVSVSAGYMNTQASGGGSANTWLLTLTFYTSGPGVPLRDEHRNGTLGWIGNSAVDNLF
ncbi:MAG TPA: hypothetical protein VFW28_14050 [Micropepsaceae bacterium]|nr:hypothetical protein [Micropepsaceae bacterium]